MYIFDERTTTMRVRWEQAAGASGYMLLYSAINATESTVEQEVRDILRRAHHEPRKRARGQRAGDMTGNNSTHVLMGGNHSAGIQMQDNTPNVTLQNAEDRS